MEPESLTLKVLVDIREELRGMRDEMGHLRNEMGHLRDEMGDLRDEQHQTNLRLAAIEGTVVEAAEQIRVLARATRVTLDAKQAHEERFDDLERRVTELEKQRS
jgi:chromosome segregation ATPase